MKLLNMKTTAMAFVCAFSGMPIANALIPTTDVAAITQKAVQQVQTMLALNNQIKNQRQQIDNAIIQAKSLTGSHNLGEILNNPALRSYMPSQYVSLYDSLKAGNSAEISQQIQALQVQQATDAKKGNAKEQYASKLLISQATTLAMYKAQDARLKNIDNLMRQINQATDSKSAADLTNRLAAESQIIQVEATKINLQRQASLDEIAVAKEAMHQEFKTNFFKH